MNVMCKHMLSLKSSTMLEEEVWWYLSHHVQPFSQF